MERRDKILRTFIYMIISWFLMGVGDSIAKIGWINTGTGILIISFVFVILFAGRMLYLIIKDIRS